MNSIDLPSRTEMMRAFTDRDASYDGIFVTGVKTTGIFCRPTCPARKPLPGNIVFFATPREAVVAGFRPCRRCRPLETPGKCPNWLAPLLDAVEDDPGRRWKDEDLRRMGLAPERVRRWFKKQYGLTFQGYSRVRRLGSAIGRLQVGGGVVQSAFEGGYESLSGFNDAVRRMHGASPSSLRDVRTLVATRIPTPLGPMIACADDDALCLLEFADRRMLDTQLARIQKRFKAVIAPGQNELLAEVSRELSDYFRGTLTSFRVPLQLSGTPFQESVWQSLVEIPYGKTVAYSDIAERIGNPEAVRAVARANGDNRIAIIVPCHRVIGKDGSLTGYGGGLWRKKRLLDIERGQLVLGAELLS